MELDAATLEGQLAARPFRPCGPLETATMGWCAPTGDDNVGPGPWRQRLSTHERTSPGAAATLAVVAEALDERVTEIEGAEVRSVGRAERRQLREQVLAEMLPRAFLRSRRVHAYLDTVAGWLMVDAAERQVCRGGRLAPARNAGQPAGQAAAPEPPGRPTAHPVGRGQRLAPGLHPRPGLRAARPGGHPVGGALSRPGSGGRGDPDPSARRQAGRQAGAGVGRAPVAAASGRPLHQETPPGGRADRGRPRGGHRRPGRPAGCRVRPDRPRTARPAGPDSGHLRSARGRRAARAPAGRPA